MPLRSPSFRSRSQRPKSFDAEGPDRRVSGTIEHEFRDSVGGDRREQNAVAMMSGGIDEPVDQSGPEDRRIIAAPRSMADPHLILTAVTIVAVLLGIFLSNQRLNTMELRIDAGINALEMRFDVMLGKVIDVDNRLTRIEERLTK